MNIGTKKDMSTHTKNIMLTGAPEGAPHTIISAALAAAANAHDAKADPSYFREEILSAGSSTQREIVAVANNTLLSAGEPSASTPENPITLDDEIAPPINSSEYCADQVYFCSGNSPNLPDTTIQSVDKLDAIALQAASTKGVVLIDSTLIATIPADELKGSLVISIDGNRDVISQITNALEGLSNIPVLRIISHGDDGILRFGNQQFDSTDLMSNTTKIAAWSKSLSDDADILLYGCSIAKTDVGKAFAQQLASITQADVGASSNLTGKGGDEVLEFQVGKVSNTLIAIAIDYESANLTLAQITVTTTADTGAGSLRQAIIDANLNSANDEIIFAASLFTNGASWITLGSSALPTIAATVSAGSLTITGPGASSLIISGNNGNNGRNYSIFEIASGGNLSISGTTISGAKTTGNGGGFRNLGTLSITNSLISGNSGGNAGGGIYSRGTVNVSGSTFTSNSANYGGGLYNTKWSSSGTVSNSTFSGNTAFRHGGGLFNNGTLAITNSTISGNTATDSQFGAGLHTNGTVNIANTIIANSTNGLDYFGATTHLISPATASSNLITQSNLAWATPVTSAQLNLGPLQNNGGPTPTMALGAGSAAKATGNPTVTSASPVNGLDQGGFTRSTTAPSVGASEYAQVITFSPQTTHSTWNKGGKVITADVNSDGKQDMVVQNIGYGEPNNGTRHDFISVFLGKGDGNFETRIDTATGSYSNWLGSGDFNGDGKIDFVTANYVGESISILLGKGDGTFNRQDMSNAGATKSPSFVIAGDMNSDGTIDILTTNLNSSNISTFLGNGNGTFQHPTLLSTSAFPRSIVQGDFDSDGKKDIVVNTDSGNTLFLGTGTGSFTSNSTIGITGTLTVADLNGDGFSDIAGTETNVVKILLGNGDATFKAAKTFSVPGVGTSVIATDINGDRFIDLQFTQFYTNAIAVLNGNGDGSFKAPITFATGSNPFSVASADFNSDTKPDLAISNLNSKNVSVLLNTSNFAPTLSPSRIVVAPGGSASISSNSEVSFSETQAGPTKSTILGVKITRDFSTFWPSSNPALSYVYLKLNGVAVGQLGFLATGTNGAYTSVSTEFFGSLSSYIPGGINTWTIGSLYNSVNLANIKVQVFYDDHSTPAIAVNGIEGTPLNFTAANFTNAYGDTENNSLASVNIATLPTTGTLKLAGADVSAGQIIAAVDLGNLSYVPAANENGTKTFMVAAFDGNHLSSASTVSMNIVGTNNAPVLAAIAVSGTEDNTFVFSATNFTSATASPGIAYIGLQGDMGAG